jgi:hypothetical protein
MFENDQGTATDIRVVFGFVSCQNTELLPNQVYKPGVGNI